MKKKKVWILSITIILFFIPTVLKAQVSDRVWPDTYGEAHICLWKDDKLGAISYTVDDNAAGDHDWWIQMSSQYGFKVTWFVITGRVTEGPVGSGGVWGTWDGFKRLYDLGHDIQTHTVTHRITEQNVEYEYSESIRTLEEKIPGNKVKVIGYPAPGGNYTNPEYAKNYFIGGRGVRGYINRVDQVEYMNTDSISTFYFESDHYASIANIIQHNPNHPFRNFYRGWQSMHFHGVSEKKENLVEGFEYVKAHEADLWTGLFREVIMYGQERDTAQVSVASAAATRIQLSVTDQQNDQLFDFPLTIKVRLDDSWNNVNAMQSGQVCQARLVTHGGNRYALVDVVPDRGSVVLTKSSVPPLLYGDVSENGQVSVYDASLAAQSAVGLISLNPSQTTKADVTCNGSVSASDASWIARRAVGFDNPFPCEQNTPSPTPTPTYGFFDDFNGDNVDTSMWHVANWWEHGGQTSPERCYTSDGYLNMIFENDSENGYLSSAIQSRQEFLYGRWEARLKPSSVPGVLNSLYTIDWDDTTDDSSTSDGTKQEIDIEFLTYTFGENTGRVHFAVHEAGKQSWGTADGIQLDFNPSDDFHIWGFEITPEHIQWFVDDQILATYRYAGNPITINAPYSLKLNTWSKEQWINGPPEADTESLYLIDWVRFIPSQ